MKFFKSNYNYKLVFYYDQFISSSTFIFWKQRYLTVKTARRNIKETPGIVIYIQGELDHPYKMYWVYEQS